MGAFIIKKIGGTGGKGGNGGKGRGKEPHGRKFLRAAYFSPGNANCKQEVDMVIANLISYILVLLGALNWGMFGIFNFNLVSAIFMGPRSVGSIIVYSLITLAAIWLIISPIVTNGMLKLRGDRVARETKNA